ncbi:MAG: hypothetical protein EOO13_07915 [Chitinophagaceae bacterium]|nr:MAG: hypothetical protein EOO13_07915 [Chitinophagaceae bacterium]
MQQQPLTNFRSLTVLHFSLLVGQVMFAAIAYYTVYSGSMGKMDLGKNETAILIAVATFALAMIVLSFSMYKKKIALLKDNNQPVKEKLMAYRAANLIRWAMMEAPVLLAIVLYMLTGDYNYMIIAGAILILFAITRPTVSKAASELSISREEAAG